MFFRLYLFLAALFVLLFLYLSSLNHQTVLINFTANSTQEFPLVPLTFIAFTLGLLVSYIISLLRQGKIFLENLKSSKGRKRLEAAEKMASEGKRAMLIGDTDKGVELLLKSFSTEPELVEPRMILANHYLEKGDCNKLASILDDVPSKFTDRVDVKMARARYALALSDFEGAARLMKEITANEDSPSVKRLLRDTYLKAGRWHDAAAIQKDVVKSLGKEESKTEEIVQVRIEHELAKKMIEDGKEEEALKKLVELTKKKKDYSPPYATLGKLHWKMEKRELAVETWKKGYDITGNMIFVFLLEDFYLREEEPQEIIDIYKKLILENPDNPLLRLFFGKLYLRLEMRDDALEHLEKAEELELKSTYLAKLIGETHFRENRLGEAAEKFKEALGLKRRILIPFLCSSCGFESCDWQGTCPNCNDWDTFCIPIEEKNN